MHRVADVALLSLVIVAAACSSQPQDVDLPESFVRVTIDKSEPERLLDYYFGGYVTPEPADPFRAGIVYDRNGRLYVNVDSLRQHQPDAADAFVDSNGSGEIEWEEFEAFIDATYNQVRPIPRSIDSLHRQVGFDREGSEWMVVEVHGVMTTALRAVFIRKAAIREAIGNYLENDRKVIYPVETTIFGEHRLDGRVVETTVMRKRTDGYWDFFVFGEDGFLAEGTRTPPRELKAPVQCVGCHFGNKLFEPEESFPAKARPGPHGPRQVYVDEPVRQPEVVRFFDEHRKRSDSILGLYSTLFVSRLRLEQRAGTLSDADSVLLGTFDL